MGRTGAAGCSPSGTRALAWRLRRLWLPPSSRPRTWTLRATWGRRRPEDRKSTRLNSSHLVISYAVFCLKKKKISHDVVCCARVDSDAVRERVTDLCFEQLPTVRRFCAGRSACCVDGRLRIHCAPPCLRG